MYAAFVELLPTLGYALVAGALTLLGFLAEFSGYSHLQTGDAVSGAWLEFVGLILLYVGIYMVGYGELWKGQLAARADVERADAE